MMTSLKSITNKTVLVLGLKHKVHNISLTLKEKQVRRKKIETSFQNITDNDNSQRKGQPDGTLSNLV